MRRTRSLGHFVILTAVILIILGNTTFAGSYATLTASSDPATFWNQFATQLGLAAELNPVRFARAYALLHVAIYDSLLASSPQHNRQPSQTAVAAGAASEVLTYLFPANASLILAEEESQSWSGQTANRGPIASGLRFGHAVGKMVVRHGESDGSDAPFTGIIPMGDCIWTGTNPVEPVAGTWKTWILTSGAEFQPEAPYPCGSTADRFDLQAVIDASHASTPERIVIVHKWADLSPPTVWNGILNEKIEQPRMGVLDSARAHAYLNVAMYDAFVSTWLTKYTYWTARPFQRIPGLKTVIRTPNFPGYTSGHSTISAAASKVMGQLFPAEQESFSAMAEEAAISRLWACIHFPHDNQQGLIVGQHIGQKVVRDMMLEPHTFVFPHEEIEARS